MSPRRKPTRLLLVRRRFKADRDRLLREAIKAYGGKCECCGERESLFLTIDHLQRKSRNEPRGHNLYRKLRMQGWPKDKYRLLCFNCNSGRSRAGGVCPHVVKRLKRAG